MAEEPALHLQRVDAARRMLERGDAPDDILAILRATGSSVMDSIKVMREVLDLSLSEAKDLIHSSRAWSDASPHFKQTHERVFEEAWKRGELIAREDGEYLKIRLSDDNE